MERGQGVARGCGVAVPAGLHDDDRPFGVELIALAGADRSLLALAARWHDEVFAAGERNDSVRIAVAGAHLSGVPLNHQLLELGASPVQTIDTAPGYRLYALPDTEPAKPGLVGGGPPDGPGIELEVWELSVEGFGRLVAGVPAPPTEHYRRPP